MPGVATRVALTMTGTTTTTVPAVSAMTSLPSQCLAQTIERRVSPALSAGIAPVVKENDCCHANTSPVSKENGSCLDKTASPAGNIGSLADLIATIEVKELNPGPSAMRSDVASTTSILPSIRPPIDSPDLPIVCNTNHPPALDLISSERIFLVKAIDIKEAAAPKAAHELGGKETCEEIQEETSFINIVRIKKPGEPEPGPGIDLSSG